MEPTEHLFRHESGRLLAALTRVLGVHRLALAEDVVQDALCRALETWKLHGPPENPAAWLMTTARNRALDVLRRERTVRAAGPELDEVWGDGRRGDDDGEAAAATRLGHEPEDELRLMLSCCHPRLAEDVQVALILNILCGFSAAELATAFLLPKATIEKRLARGKKVLSSSRRLFAVDAAAPEVPDTRERLTAVQRALYLLFNEGHHGGSEIAVRRELCEEARRLLALLLAHPATAAPSTFALGALMCLHEARQPARVGSDGVLRSLRDQDRALWDRALIAQGLALLDRSAAGTELTVYHLEAAIAALHAQAPSVAATPWPAVVALYDALVSLRPSPVVALGRALALAERDGPAAGLQALAALEGRERLAAYPFFEAAQGELTLRLGDTAKARAHFAAAVKLARNPLERQFLATRLAACDTTAALDGSRLAL